MKLKRNAAASLISACGIGATAYSDTFDGKHQSWGQTSKISIQAKASQLSPKGTRVPFSASTTDSILPYHAKSSDAPGIPNSYV